MTTTIMRNSRVGDAWIAEACRINPVQRVVNPETGLPSGNILTGPVRLSFPNLLTPRTPKAGDNNPGKFECSVLFTPYADFTIFYEEYYRQCAKDWSDKLNPADGQYYGLENPFHQQAAKSKYEGYTAGCTFLNLKSQYKPSCVDANMNPIVQEGQLHPGVWVIASVNPYSFGKTQPKKGVGFGLQSIMLIGDDMDIGGGGVDPRSQFKGVNVTPPAVAPSAAFGQPTQSTNANAGFVTPGAPPRPPMGPPGYTMPGQPVYAPPPAPAFAQPPASEPCFVCGSPVNPHTHSCVSCGTAQG